MADNNKKEIEKEIDEQIKKRLNDLRKDNKLVTVNMGKENFISPRKRDFNFNKEPLKEEIKPSKDLNFQSVEENLLKPKSPNTNHTMEKTKKLQKQKTGSVTLESGILKPRKKSKRNEFLNPEQKAQIEATVEASLKELKEKDKILLKEEKRLLKEANKLQKIVKKKDIEIYKMQNSKTVDMKAIEKTVEIRDNYANAMQEINKNIMRINSNYRPDMSLAERKKQIYNNASIASTERARKLFYIREKESKGETFKKTNLSYLYRKSNFHKNLESGNEYLKQRNPFYERLRKINDNEGVSLSQEFNSIKDRVSERWREKKGLNSNLKVQKPKVSLSNFDRTVESTNEDFIYKDKYNSNAEGVQWSPTSEEND